MKRHSLIFAFLFGVLCAGAEARGILCLTFDDRNWERWEATMPLFAKYKVHASFFPNGPLDAKALASLKKLHDAGHAVGPHTVHHADADKFVSEHGFEAFWEQEVKPQVDAYATVGITPKVMAYANNRHTPQVDEFLKKKGFVRFRCGAEGTDWGPNRFGKKHAKAESAFLPAADFPRMTLAKGIGVGEYYKTDIDDLLTAIDRIAEKDECLVIYSHDIRPDAKGLNMKTEWLEKILARAAAKGVVFGSLAE